MSLLNAPSADAHDGQPHDENKSTLTEIGLLKHNSNGPCKTGYQIKGTDLCTHGPDPAPPGYDITRRVLPRPRRLTAKTVAGSPVCESNGSDGNRFQVMYVRASDKPDRYNEYLDTIRQVAAAADDIYYYSAQETGGKRHLRFVTTPPDANGNCDIVVLNIVLSPIGDDTFGNSINELAALGYNLPSRKYMILVDTTSAGICGIANFWYDADSDSNNSNNFGPSYARADAGCWSGYVLAHESMHNLGAIQLSAPHSSGAGHCIDDYDVMCYPDSPNTPPIQILCNSLSHEDRFDCNHDDYFHTKPPANNYLSTHWNTANNKFLIGAGIDDDVPDIGIVKTASRSVVMPGQQLIYILSISNTGKTTSAQVIMTDALPSGFSLTSAALITPTGTGDCAATLASGCAVGALAPGQFATVTIIGNAPSVLGVITNTAGIVATDDFEKSNNFSLITTTVRLLSFNLSDARTIEGNSGTHPMNFVLSIDSAVATPVTVSYHTTNGTAISPNDYEVVNNGQAVIPAGQTSTIIAINIVGDLLVEANETFTVTLSNSLGAVILDGEGIGTILKDDIPVFMVTNTNDSDAGSLRDAIASANATDGSAIQFNLGAGAHTITLSNGGLSIEQNLIIDGPTNGALTVSGNNASGVFATSAVVQISNLIIAKSQGSAIYQGEGVLTLTNVILNENIQPSGYGGAISQVDGKLTLNNVTLSNNTSGFAGGAIAQFNGLLTLNNVTLSGNSTGNWGGGIYQKDGPGAITLNNVTLNGNSAFLGGGLMQEGGMMTLTNVTVNGNSATYGGGLYAINIAISNTILANNTGGDCQGGLNQANYVIIKDSYNDACGLSNSGTVRVGTNPLLGPLANNGGATLTHAPLPSSPAKDTGSCVLPFDQRGVARPQGGACDIGAVEVLSGISINDASIPEGNSDTRSLVFVISIDTPLAVPVTVNYVTSNGSAVSPADYVATVAGQATILAGQTSVNVAIVVIGDTQIEENETFIVTLSNPVGAVIADGEGIGTIVNDDFAPVIVNNPTDNGVGSLRDAIVNAPSGSTLQLNLGTGPQTIILTTGPLILDKILTIEGPSDGSLTISGNDNSSVFIINANAKVKISNLTIARGRAVTAGGGGIAQMGGEVSVENVTLRENVSNFTGLLKTQKVSYATYGGGIMQEDGVMSLKNVTINGNSAQVGGGIFQHNGDMALANVTINDNSALFGGGIYQDGGGSITVTNITVMSNSASSAGGGILGHNMTISNTIIANNTGGDCRSDYGPQLDPNRIQYVIIKNTGINACGLNNSGTIRTGIDPLLGVLANNGGDLLTHVPLSGSPAINTGSCVLPFDQRGLARPQGAVCDIGAVEFRLSHTVYVPNTRRVVISGW